MGHAGRPSIRTKEIEDEICHRIACKESLNRICKDDHMPNFDTVMKWLQKEDENGEFYTKYKRARELQAEAHADEMMDIADDGSNDYMEKLDKDGNIVGWALNGESVARSKLRLEQRRWNAEKLKPRRFGAKIAVGGAEDLPPIQRKDTIDITGLSIEELDVLQRALTGGTDGE